MAPGKRGKAQAFQECFDDLVLEVQGDLHGISTRAHARNLISQETLETVTDQQNDIAQRSIILVSSVQASIGVSEDNFDAFVAVLREEPAVSGFADTLERTLQRLQGSTWRETRDPPRGIDSGMGSARVTLREYYGVWPARLLFVGSGDTTKRNNEPPVSVLAVPESKGSEGSADRQPADGGNTRPDLNKPDNRLSPPETYWESILLKYQRKHKFQSGDPGTGMCTGDTGYSTQSREVTNEGDMTPPESEEIGESVGRHSRPPDALVPLGPRVKLRFSGDEASVGISEPDSHHSNLPNEPAHPSEGNSSEPECHHSNLPNEPSEGIGADQPSDDVQQSIAEDVGHSQCGGTSVLVSGHATTPHDPMSRVSSSTPTSLLEDTYQMRMDLKQKNATISELVLQVENLMTRLDNTEMEKRNVEAELQDKQAEFKRVRDEMDEKIKALQNRVEEMEKEVGEYQRQIAKPTQNSGMYS